jgi:hypothetical protein
MGLAERKRTSEEVEAVPCPVFSAAKAGTFPGKAIEATVAATEPLKNFRRLKTSFFSRFFKVKLLLIRWPGSPGLM